MAAPTLETNAAADTLRIMGGNSGNPVTWNDVWDWDDGGGSSGGAGDVPKDGGGTAKVNTFMTEIVADKMYRILRDIDFGDGVAPTYFLSIRELVFFDSCEPRVKNNATLSLGKLQGDWGVDGSDWHINHPDDFFLSDSSAVLKIYASHLHKGANTQKYLYLSGDVDIRNSILSSICDQGAGNYYAYMWFRATLSNLHIRESYINNFYRFSLSVIPDSFENNHLHYFRSGFMKSTSFPVTIDNFKLTEVSGDDIQTFGAANHTELIDPEFTIGSLSIAQADKVIYEGYKCNIHIADKDGNDLSGVSVLIEDKNGDTISYVDSTSLLNEDVAIAETDIDVDDGTDFSIGQVIRINREYMTISNIVGNALTVTRETLSDYTPDAAHLDNAPIYINQAVITDINGDIAEQVIAYKKWQGTSETLTTLSPHKFTISKAGYETMVLDNITVDHPIVWHLELLDELAEGDVRDGVAYGEGSEGNLELPAVGDVEAGVDFGSNGVEFTGTFGVPPEADVRDGEGYGAGGAEFEGDLDLPAIGDVEKGVQFDSLTKTGTFKKPAESDVRDGSQYGKDDTEFTGTLDLPAEADVEDGVTFDGATKEGNFEAPAEADVEKDVGYGSNGAEFTGTFEVPAEEDVEVGVGYGSLGTEFEGTYLGLKGNNLTAVLEKSVALTGHLEKKVSLTGELKS